MEVMANTVWSHVASSFRRVSETERSEQRVDLTVQHLQKIVDDCKTGRFCRPLEDPSIRFNELKGHLEELRTNLSELITAATPLCMDLIRIYVTQSYKDLRNLITFASVHLRNVPNISKAVVETGKSLEKVLSDVKKIVVDSLKQFIENTLAKITVILKDFISANKGAFGTTALSITQAIVSRGIIGTSAFVGRRALMATSTVAAVAVPAVSVGSMVYKCYKRRKLLKEIETEIMHETNCYGLRDTRVKLISTANDFREQAKVYDERGDSELALIFVRGNIRIREIEETLSDVNCKCFSENIIIQ